MKFVNDPEHLPTDPKEQFAQNLDAAMAAEVYEGVYEEAVADPRRLQELIDFGWSVKKTVDDEGKIKSIEIRNKEGALVFYENYESMRELKSKQKEN